MAEDTAVRAELSALALTNLTAYLSAAGRVDRLLLLFADDRRLVRRVDPNLRSWDGYQQDLEAAWHALDRALAEPDSPSVVADPMPHCVRLALVRGTVSSADEIPPSLLVAAVSTGHWSAERALSTVSRYPSPARRAVGYYRLLVTEDLDPAVRRTIQSQVVELAQLPAKYLPARALLTRLDLLDSAARNAVADRLAEDAVVVNDWHWDRIHGRAGSHDDGRNASAEDVIRVFEAIPETRRPTLVAKVADALLTELGGSTRKRKQAPTQPPPHNPTPLQPTSLMERHYHDSVEATFDPERARRQAGESLARLAAFLSCHPDPPRLLDRVVQVMPLIADRHIRSDLAARYQAAAAACSLTRSWAPESEDVAGSDGGGDGSDSETRYRRDLLRQIYERQGTPEPVDDQDSDQSADDGLFLAPSLDELNRRWLAAVMPWPAASEPDQAGESTDEGEPAEPPAVSPAVFAELEKIGGPAFVAAYAAVHQLPDEAIYSVIRKRFNPDDLPGQFFIIDFIGEQEGREQIRDALRTVKGALLSAAIAHAFLSGSIHAAWQGIPADYISDIDFTPVLDMVLTLPAEKQRNSIRRMYAIDEALRLHDLPRLSALALLLPYLDGEQLGRAFMNIMDLQDPAVRRIGLEMIAPRLNVDQVAHALSALDVAPDAREQTWFFNGLAHSLERADPRRREIEGWGEDAVIAMRTGGDFGIVALLLRRDATQKNSATVGDSEDTDETDETASLPDATVLADERVITALRAMDPNNRVDALLSLASNTTGPLPPEIVAEILALPVADAVDKYSWRGFAMAAMANRLPKECLSAAYEAAMELPHRLLVGDAQAWGWSWSHEYPRGAVLFGLTPRLRGRLAQAAFEAARELPWAPREEILRRLAEHADEELARALFDYFFEMHQMYMDLPDSAGTPYVLEQTVVMEPIPIFKIYREVQLAEMIAATAAKLDPERLTRAVAQALAFGNVGPRSWLPARLMPFVASEQRDPMLSSAVVAATEFIHDDPSRLDLVTDLLPYMRAEIDRRKQPAEAFVAARFPGHRGLLTAEQVRTLTEAGLLEYCRLIGVERMQEMTAATSETDVDAKRRYLITVILSPFFAENLQGLLVTLLAGAPLDARLDALEDMKQILEHSSHEEVVRKTLRQVLESDMDPTDRVRRLHSLLPHVDQPVRDSLVDVVQLLPGPPIEDDETLCTAMVDELYQDFGKALRDDPRFDQWRHNLMIRVIRRDLLDDRFNEAVKARRGRRVQLLGFLASQLSPDGLTRAIEIVLHLPEIERGDGIAALLPAATGHAKERLVAALFALTSPFARLWALFNSQKELDTDERPELTELARSTAEAFSRPTNVAGCLLLLIGYSGDERGRWMERILRIADKLPADHALQVLSIVIAMCSGDTELERAVLDRVCALPTDDAVHTGVRMITRRGVDVAALAGDRLPHLRAVASRRLRATAERGRTELLRTLAGETSAFRALTTPDGIYEMARAVRDVCSG